MRPAAGRGVGPQIAHAAELAIEPFGAQFFEPRAEQLEDHAADVAAARQDLLEQGPDRFGRSTRVGVEIEAVELEPAGNVDLDDLVEVEAIEEGRRVDAQVARIGMEVVQVEQQPASRRRRQRVQKAGLVECRFRVLEIGDVVLDQERRGDPPLDVEDAPCDQVEGLRSKVTGMVRLRLISCGLPSVRWKAR